MSRKTRLSSMVFIVWLLVIIAIMLLTQILDIETFFILAMIGLLVVIALTTTTTVQPRYLRRLKYVIATALLIFGYIVANRIVEILAR